MAEVFSNLLKYLKQHIQDTQYTPRIVNLKKRHQHLESNFLKQVIYKNS